MFSCTFNRYFLFLWLGLSRCVFALDLELTQGVSSALPIAVASFGSSVEAQQLTDILRHDLQYSGQFKILGQPNQALTTREYKGMGADTVVSGRVEVVGANTIKVSFQLIDAAIQGRVLQQEDFQIKAPQLRAITHHIADLVYEKLTGERGVFSTRLAYILVQRQTEATRYTLEVSDIDGANPQTLIRAVEPIMSPTWSPDGHHIAYVSFEKKKAQIFMVDVTNGRRRLITSFPGINGAPAWSPDGRHMAVVLSKSGSPKIYSIELATGALKQLTFGDAMDTEPRYSPDGQSILFTSGRGGAPQVYQLAFNSGQITRLTYKGNYNARASYTPNQQNLVLMHREDKGFHIAAQDLSGNLLALTGSSADESPSVAPNGRLIVYATRANQKGLLGIVSIDGRIHLRLPARNGDIQEPAWSPFV